MIEESTALQAKELEMMAYFAQILTDTLQIELGVDERDARIAAGLLISVHRQIFEGPASRRLRASTAPPRSSACAQT